MPGWASGGCGATEATGASRGRNRSGAMSTGMRPPAKAKQSSVSWAMGSVYQPGRVDRTRLDQIGDRFDVVEVEHGVRAVGQGAVAGHRDHRVVAGPQRWLPNGRTEHLELGVARVLEALDQHEVDRRQIVRAHV